MAARPRIDRPPLRLVPTSRRQQPLRLLVVLGQAARGTELRQRLEKLSGDRPLELRVIAPAYGQSMLKYLASDADDGIRRAQGRLRELVGELNRDEMTAQGKVGDAHPLFAIEDALGSFPADEIVILPSPEGGNQWAENNLFEQVRRRFYLPVREIQLEGSSSGARAKQTAFSPAVMRRLASELGTRSD